MTAKQIQTLYEAYSEVDDADTDIAISLKTLRMLDLLVINDELNDKDKTLDADVFSTFLRGVTETLNDAHKRLTSAYEFLHDATIAERNAAKEA